MAAPNLSRLRITSNVTNSNFFIENLPQLPTDVKKRFPSLEKYEKEQKEFTRRLTFQLQGGGR